MGRREQGLPHQLPYPCDHGHYWLGQNGDSAQIFLITGSKKDYGKYMIADSEGVVFESVEGKRGAKWKIKAFDTPEEAFEELQSRLLKRAQMEKSNNGGEGTPTAN